MTIYFTGIGPVDNPVPTGQPAPNAPLSRATNPCRVQIGTTSPTALYCGLTPQSTGLAQLNVQLPNLPPGDYSVRIFVGNAASNQALIAIR